MSPEEEVIRAGEARQILDARMFIEARKHLEGQLSQARRQVPIADEKMHTRLILMEQLSGNLFAYFEQIAQTGRMAAIQLETQERRKGLFEQGVAMFRQYGRNS